MAKLHEIWQRITRTSRARALEFEIARLHAETDRQRIEIDRLRGENRALLNSILGVAGIPPIPADYSTERALSAAAHATEIAPATLAPGSVENFAAATTDASRRAPSFFNQSHSESAGRPLADDDSTFRLARFDGPPPPANHAGTQNLPALRQEPARSDSSGAPLHSEQGTRPRNDSLHVTDTSAAQEFSVGARQVGPPGRRLVEPGGSVVPGNDSWREAAHSTSNSAPSAQGNIAGQTSLGNSRDKPALRKPRPIAPPHRRRSWHQINRILEIESARKPLAGD